MNAPNFRKQKADAALLLAMHRERLSKIIEEWRVQAAECRAAAETMKDRANRDAMIALAEGYEAMIARAEEALNEEGARPQEPPDDSPESS
jgi:hypothetical protein